MTKTDPIIAVKDVEQSSKWYQSIFACKSIHGGGRFDVLVTETSEVLICLHQWGEHEHPTMVNQEIPAGNGLILYFRTKKLDLIHQNAKENGATFEEAIRVNPNTNKREFSLRDPDGYYLIISEYHEY